jgi:hypothetical protein
MLVPYDGGSPTLQAMNQNFAALAALAQNGGSTYLFLGIPLTGVGFSQAMLTVVNANQTIVSNPAASGKRYLVEVWGSNLSSSVPASLSVFRTNGTISATIQVGQVFAVSATGLVTQYITLDQGESCVVIAPTGSLLVTASVMSYDASSPLKGPAVWGLPLAGNNPIYTVPAGATSFFMRTNALLAPFTNSASALIGMTNNDSFSVNYSVIAGGTTLFGPSTVITTGSLQTEHMLTAGTQVSILTSVAAPNTAVNMGLIWERPN